MNYFNIKENERISVSTTVGKDFLDTLSEISSWVMSYQSLKNLHLTQKVENLKRVVFVGLGRLGVHI
jgi:hypothetical protein